MGGELMYKWIIYSATMGTIGTQSSTHSPTVSTTTQDANGNDVTTQEFDASLLPGGFALIGLYDDKTPMDNATQTAYDNPQAWLYQGGNFVANPTYNANAVALANIKTAQSALHNSAYAHAMAACFASSAD